MTGRELLLRAIDGQEVDRIPWVPFSGVHSASLIDTDATTFLNSADLVVRGQNEAIRRYRPDGIPVVFDLQVEAEVLGCELKWADDNPPAVVSHPLEGGYDGLSALRLPEADDGRIPVVLEATRRLRAEHPDLALYGLVTGPFTLALHLLGTRVFTDMFDCPDDLQNLLGFCADVGVRMSELLAGAGADIVAVVDPMTSQIGPDHFAELCTPHARRIFDRVRELGLESSFFVCGHAQKNVEAMCDCGCDNVSIDENIPLDYVRDICREKGVSFGGNLQLTVVMLTGTPDDNRRNAVECMEIGGHTGFVLAPGCDMPYATPPENVEAIAELVHDEYARQVARQLAQEAGDTLNAFDLTQYGSGEKVIVDVITLDSEACAPCQYMVESVKQVAPQFEGIVEWREHKIKYRESIAFMSSLMVHNIPTICIDGKIAFVSRIPPREELVEALQRRINEKLRLRIRNHRKVIRVYGPPTPECLEARESVRKALKELGSDVGYEEIEDEATCQAAGVFRTPAVTITRQVVKAAGAVPTTSAVKEWVKQLDE